LTLEYQVCGKPRLLKAWLRLFLIETISDCKGYFHPCQSEFWRDWGFWILDWGSRARVK
jgi:hypothetical protein